MFKNKEQQFDFYWKEIFTGLAYNPIEFNTYRFDQTMSLPGKVNKLYDMFKVLATNNQEVMNYLKEFVETFDSKLYETIEDVLIVWLEDGRLADVVRVAISEEVIEARTSNTGVLYSSLKERLDTENAEINVELGEVTEKINYVKEHGLYGEKIVSLDDFKRDSLDVSDNNRILKALLKMNDGDTLFIGCDIEIDKTIRVNKRINILSFGSTVKTIKEGLDVIFNYTGIKSFFISGLRFNQNLIGRTSIEINTCENFVVENCYFTGYSMEYGYYQTDGGIRVENSKNGLIRGNEFIEHGGQYDTTNLNRCITIHGNSDLVTISNNTFSKVNQAVVVEGGNHVFIGNRLDNVRDNSLYLLNKIESFVVSGNSFDDRYDECIVMSSGDITIVGNEFKNSPNRTLVINGDVKNIVVDGNTFNNKDVDGGKFISWRNASDLTVNTMVVTNNVFEHPNNKQTNTEYFEMGNVNYLIFSGNKIEGFTADYQRLLYFKGIKANGKINNNIFIGTNDNAKSIEIANSVVSGIIEWVDNIQVKCRGVHNPSRMSVKGSQIQTNIGPYILSSRKESLFYSDGIPTNNRFSQGDIALNFSKPSTSSPIGWIFDGEKWLNFGLVNTNVFDWQKIDGSRFGFQWISNPSNDFKVCTNSKRGYLSGSFKSGATTNGTRILTLSDDYKPVSERLILAESGGNLILLRLDIGGNLFIHSSEATSEITIVGEYSYTIV